MKNSVRNTKSVKSIIPKTTNSAAFKAWLKSCPVDPADDQWLKIKVNLSPESIHAIHRHACIWGETFDQFVQTLIELGLQRWEELPGGSPNDSNVQPLHVTIDAENKAAAARLGKAFEQAILGNGNVEIFPGLPMAMTEASSLICMAKEDQAGIGRTLKENLAAYMQDALIDRNIDYRNGDGPTSLTQPLP